MLTLRTQIIYMNKKNNMGNEMISRCKYSMNFREPPSFLMLALNGHCNMYCSCIQFVHTAALYRPTLTQWYPIHSILNSVHVWVIGKEPNCVVRKQPCRRLILTWTNGTKILHRLQTVPEKFQRVSALYSYNTQMICFRGKLYRSKETRRIYNTRKLNFAYNLSIFLAANVLCHIRYKYQIAIRDCKGAI